MRRQVAERVVAVQSTTRAVSAGASERQTAIFFRRRPVSARRTKEPCASPPSQRNGVAHAGRSASGETLYPYAPVCVRTRRLLLAVAYLMENPTWNRCRNGEVAAFSRLTVCPHSQGPRQDTPQQTCQTLLRITGHTKVDRDARQNS